MIGAEALARWVIPWSSPRNQPAPPPVPDGPPPVQSGVLPSSPRVCDLCRKDVELIGLQGGEQQMWWCSFVVSDKTHIFRLCKECAVGDAA